MLYIGNVDGPEASYTATPATCDAANGAVVLSPIIYDYLWQDSSTLTSRNDLMAGNYLITVTDPANPDCPGILLVTVGEDSPLTATHVVGVVPNCELSNGEVTIAVAGGSGTYNYTWSDGFVGSNVRVGISAGIYTVTIEDTNGSGCDLEYTFTLDNNVPAATITIADTINVSCNNAFDGGINFTIDYNPAFSGPADTLVLDGQGNEYVTTNLGPGNYCLIIEDASDCIAGSACFTISEPDPLSMLAVLTPPCESDTSGAAMIFPFGGTEPYGFDWADLPDSLDVNPRTDMEAGTYSLEITDAQGCTLLDDVIVLPNCPKEDCDFFFGLDSLLTEAPNCASAAAICLDIEIAEFEDYTILVNDVEYTGMTEGCAWDTLVLYRYDGVFGQLTLGPYTVTSWEVDNVIYNGEFQDVQGLLDSMNQWVPSGSWTANTTDQFITGLDPSISYGPLTIVHNNSGISNTVGVELPETPRGLNIFLDTGYYEIVLENSVLGCSDTLITEVSCNNSYPTIRDTLCYNEEVVFCIDTTRLNLRGPISSIGNVCELDSDGEVAFRLDTAALCVTYVGLLPGIDSACYEICDVTGVCDTLDFEILVGPCLGTPPTVFCDTVFINQTDTICF